MEMMSYTEIVLSVWGVVVSLLCSYYYAQLRVYETTAITPSRFRHMIETNPLARQVLRNLLDRVDGEQADRTSS